MQKKNRNNDTGASDLNSCAWWLPPYVITVLEEIKPVEVMSLMCVNNGCADLRASPQLTYWQICLMNFCFLNNSV